MLASICQHERNFTVSFNCFLAEKSLKMGRGKPTDTKIRETIVKKFYQGISFRKIAAEVGLSWTTVQGIIKHFGKTASVKICGKSTGRPAIVTERNRRLLLKICKNSRRASLRDITAQWNNQTGLNVTQECCRKWIHKCGLSFYKVNLN